MLKLYENIKKLRLQNNLSQAELAEEAGYTNRSSIAKIEKGEVDLPQSKIKLFADIFNVTPAYLMGWTENKYENNDSTDSHFECTKSTKSFQNETQQKVLRIIQRGSEKFNEQDYERMLRVLNATFDDAFEDDGSDGL